MEYQYTNERNIQIMLALLKAHNIKKVIASPGATNLSIVASMQQDPYFEMYSCVDERSAAYMACGLAAESGEPVVLSCTGATSSRNYMPGLTEAYYRKLPVIAITSSQVNENIGHLSAQCTDRTVLPNDVVKKSVQVPPVRIDSDIKDREIKVNDALLECRRHGGGPVHINLSTTYNNFSTVRLPQYRSISRITSEDIFPELPTGRIAVFVSSHKKWTEEQTNALDRFCATNNAVAFCDHSSGYKGKYRVLFALVASQVQKRSSLLDVDLLIHIGEISGDYYSLSVKGKQCWRVNEDGEIRDKFGNITHIFQMGEAKFFNHYSKDGQNNHSYLDECKNEIEQVKENIPELPFSNIWIASVISPLLPDNSVLHLGILNSLRSWNFFEIPDKVLSYSNVGGFGIDGDISSLVGASLANPQKIYFGVLGDLAFFYDLNILGNHHIGKNVRLLLINNGRGTEFRNYGHQGTLLGEDADKYVAAAGHFGNKSKYLIRHYAEDLEFEYLTASDKESFQKIYKRFITPQMTDKPMVFEVFTDSKDESQALEWIRNITKGRFPKVEIKKTVKNILGEQGTNALKNIFGK